MGSIFSKSSLAEFLARRYKKPCVCLYINRQTQGRKIRGSTLLPISRQLHFADAPKRLRKNVSISGFHPPGIALMSGTFPNLINASLQLPYIIATLVTLCQPKIFFSIVRFSKKLRTIIRIFAFVSNFHWYKRLFFARLAKITLPLC